MLETLTQMANEWLERIQNPAFWWQIVAVVLALLIATLFNRRVQNVLREYDRGGPGFRHVAMRSVQRLLWPLASLALLLPAKAIVQHYQQPMALLNIAISLLVALALVRISVYLLHRGFSKSPLLDSWEHFIATVIWIGVGLHILGWLPAVLSLLDSVGMTAGDTRITILSASQLLLMILVAFILALWLSGLVANWLKRSPYISPGMRVGFGKFTKFLFLTLAFLISLNAVGIDLSSLAVFGGALGVGLGFGLQRITSNFISGFILVMDKSIKPGDVITVGDNFGWVEELNSRYMVVRNREGVDTLIPNENLITSEVINWSYGDRNVRLKIEVQISYEDNPEKALEILVDCAHVSARVLQDPAPVARLIKFADSGMVLELRVWISDPEKGPMAVRSDICLAIWRAFKEAGITIPYPQRDLHVKSGLPDSLSGRAGDGD